MYLALDEEKEEFRFYPGDRVEKVSGYEYFGIVVSSFNTMDGLARYVVESTSRGSEGMLHIFTGDQLRLENREVYTENKDGN